MSKEEKSTAPIEEPRTFSDAIGGGDFHSDLPRINFKEILDRQVLVIDASLIEDFKSKDYGVHDCLLLLIELQGKQYTTITSGEVIIKRVMKAKTEGLLPLKGTITKGNYYNIL